MGIFRQLPLTRSGLEPIEELAVRYLHSLELFATGGVLSLNSPARHDVEACQRPALRESAGEHGLSAIREEINRKLRTALMIWFHSQPLDFIPDCVQFHHISIAFTDHRKLKLVSSQNARAVETPIVRSCSIIEISDLDPCPYLLLCRWCSSFVKRRS
jgi:hypothetical protein